MAQGKKFGAEIKEKALALLASGKSVPDVAKELKLNYNTVYGWNVRQGKDDPHFEELKSLKKEEFIKNAWECVMKSQRLIMRRLERVERSEDAIDKLIDEIVENTDEDVTFADKRALINKLAAIELPDLSKLGVIMGTMYDKFALASNEPTAVVGGQVTLKRFEEL